MSSLPTEPLAASTSVSDAVASRRSIRRFLPDPVDPEVLRKVLTAAQAAPSGGNLQPWQAHVLTGAPLVALRAAIAAELPHGRAAHDHEYAVYPRELGPPYTDRRFEVGEAMYAALGIGRDDKPARLAQFAANFRAFDAPVLMLVHLDRVMGPPQWADTGMWLQTVMLLLREAGLDSCAQEAWAVYHRQIRSVVAIPDHHVLFCGLAIGYRDSAAAINRFSGRARAARWRGDVCAAGLTDRRAARQGRGHDRIAPAPLVQQPDPAARTVRAAPPRRGAGLYVWADGL